MSRVRRARAVTLAALATVLAAVLALPPAAGAAARCPSAAKPTGLKFQRAAGERIGILRWRAPRSRPPGMLGYRVWRGGRVVGQTRGRRMRIRVQPGRRYVFVVRAITRRGAGRCAGRLARRLRFQAPGRPLRLGVESMRGDTAMLGWSPGRPGDGVLAGYRLYRDGRVMGQVRARTARVRLATVKHFRFAVAAVDTRGHVGLRSAAVTIRADHDVPPPPTELVVTRVGDRDADLSWSPSRPLGGRIMGYRIYRDGVLAKQSPTLSATVGPLASGRRYRFSVAAVDSFGYVSSASDPVSVSTDHRGPGAPGALSVTGVTDRDVTLRWGAAAPGSGPLAGYRVSRNREPLNQVPEAGTIVSNLAPATPYTFTVAAVDSWGYLGPASAAVNVTTAPPDGTQGAVHAFLLASTDQSFLDFQAHYKQIGTLYPTYFDCRPDGSLDGVDDPLITGWAKLRALRVLPRVNCQSGTRLHQILTDGATRAANLDAIVDLVRMRDYDGINIDYESGAATDRDALTSYIATLAGRLHGLGKRLTVEVSAKSTNTTTGRSGFYDYAALGGVADTVFVMNWGLHWSTSAPGPLDDITWARKVADYTASMPNRARFVLGTNLYGFDWPGGGGPSNRATALEWSDIRALIARTGSTPRFDEPSQSWTFKYTDAGTPHEVWYTDARSVAVRIRLARDRGLGIGLWRLGREDPGVWADPAIAPGTPWP